MSVLIEVLRRHDRFVPPLPYDPLWNSCQAGQALCCQGRADPGKGYLARFFDTSGSCHKKPLWSFTKIPMFWHRPADRVICLCYENVMENSRGQSSAAASGQPSRPRGAARLRSAP